MASNQYSLRAENDQRAVELFEQQKANFKRLGLPAPMPFIRTPRTASHDFPNLPRIDLDLKSIRDDFPLDFKVSRLKTEANSNRPVTRENLNSNRTSIKNPTKNAYLENILSKLQKKEQRISLNPVETQRWRLMQPTVTDPAGWLGSPFITYYRVLEYLNSEKGIINDPNPHDFLRVNYPFQNPHKNKENSNPKDYLHPNYVYLNSNHSSRNGRFSQQNSHCCVCHLCSHIQHCVHSCCIHSSGKNKKTNRKKPKSVKKKKIRIPESTEIEFSSSYSESESYDKESPKKSKKKKKPAKQKKENQTSLEIPKKTPKHSTEKDKKPVSKEPSQKSQISSEELKPKKKEPKKKPVDKPSGSPNDLSYKPISLVTSKISSMTF